MSSKGLVCPTCGTNLYDVEQTSKTSNKVIRFRRCENRHRIKTEERVVASPRSRGEQAALKEKVLLLLKTNSMAAVAAKLGVPIEIIYYIHKRKAK